VNNANALTQHDAQEVFAKARDAVDKRHATAFARLALRGYTCHRLPEGYIVGRWGLMRELADLDELERFVAVVDGPAR
jgi:hypothetical protein